MKIAKKYSHLNGEEYLLVHHKELYGKRLYSPIDLNKEFTKNLISLVGNQYYVTTDQKLLSKLISLP